MPQASIGFSPSVPEAGRGKITDTGAMMFKQQFSDAQDACALAQAIVDTVREPMLVLDSEFRVIAASRSFYLLFSAKPTETLGKHLYDLADRAWDIPALNTLLGNILFPPCRDGRLRSRT
jgi:PAS domain-containing protein